MKKKILIIDDNEDLRNNLKGLLEESDFIPFSAKCGVDGILKARELLPDLIICDILMPDIDGYKVFTKLKESEETRYIPFIFLSAKSEYSDFREGMNLGADDYLSKPFFLADLLAAIHTRLKKYGKEPNYDTTNTLLKPNLAMDENIYLPYNNSFLSLKVSNVDYITALGAYTNIFISGGKKVITRKLLKEWEEILPSDNFIRIHRSTIINLHSISRIDKWFNNSLAVHLLNYSEPIIASRRFSKKLKKYMIL